MVNGEINWPGWETVRLIGRGSFGAVYEIQRDVLGDVEKAALKVISIPQNASDIDEMYSDGYDDESITSTFQSHLKSIVAEYSLMRKMNGCSNIVNCDDVRYVQHDDGIGWDIFIKMELLTPLTRALPDEIPEDTVIHIAKDICAALVLCKKHGIVHRDIKPQNIFVSENGDYKLGDFGIAKTVEKTMGGTKIGTYKYMAPEVYNNQPYGSSADIYSLGLVLYWLLNERRMPFMPLPPAKIKAGMDEDARHRRLSGEQILAPAHGCDELKRIVLKACAYDPKDRYASAAMMLDDLNKLTGAARVSAAIVSDGTTDTKQDDDLTVGPVFGDEQKQNDSKAEELESDTTVGPAFGLNKPAEHTDALSADSSDAATPSASVQKDKKPKLSNHIIVIVLALVVVVIGISLLLRSCVKEQRVNGSNYTEGSSEKVPVTTECAHIWTPASCVAPKTCSVCGKTEGDALGHEWIATTCETPKTCSVCGKTEGTALGHTWKEATFTTPKTCSSCGLTEGTVKARIVDISAGSGHTLVLKSDGTVQAIGNNEHGECNVSSWTNIVDICAGSSHSVGIKEDGTVVATGCNDYGQCDVSSWSNIVYIAAGNFHTVGVKADGTVVAVGSNHNGGCEVSSWRNVVAVGVTQTGTVGLTADGKILNTKYEELNWSGISTISVGEYLAIGLKNNGTVVIGDPWDHDSMLYADAYERFSNIISVEAGRDCVLGITADGRVVTAPGFDYHGVSEWTDICMIAAGSSHIVGLKSDGTLVAAGSNYWGECDVGKIN